MSDDKMPESDKDPIADALGAEFTSASKEKDGDEEKDKTMGEKAEDAGAPKDEKDDEKDEKKDKDDAKEASCAPMAKRPGPWMEKKDSTMSKKADLLDRAPGSYLAKR